MVVPCVDGCQFRKGLWSSQSHDSSWDEILPDQSSLLSLKRDTQQLKETLALGE